MKTNLPLFAIACLALLPGRLPAQSTFTTPASPVSMSVSVSGSNMSVTSGTSGTGTINVSIGAPTGQNSLSLPIPPVTMSISVNGASGASATGPGTVSTGAMQSAWLAAAQSAKNAEVITENESGPFARFNKNVVVKGNIAGPVSIVHGDFYLLGSVSGPVSVLGGNATILGTVNGPVSVVHGTLRIAGRINGAASASGGNIIRSNGSVVTGSTSSGSMGLPFPSNGFRHGHFPILFWILLHGFLLVLWVAAAVLLGVAMPGTLAGAAAVIRNDPLQTAAVGLLFWIVFWCLALVAGVLCFILVGLPLMGLLVIVYIAVKWFGMTAVFLCVGEEICSRMKWSVTSALMPVLAGVLALGLVRMIPVAGFFVWLIAGLPAAGAIVMSIARSSRARPDPMPVPPVLP